MSVRIHRATLSIALWASTVAPLVAQTGSGHTHGGRTHGGHSAAADTADAEPSKAVHEAMSGRMIANAHLRVSPTRGPNAADSARAARIVSEARAALEKYKDVRAAERDGFRMFAPNVKDQPVYHFTSLGAAVRERFEFDAARPSSLLYRKDANGPLRLVGAMYTAPRNASWDELDERVPLSMARWHLHTNMCVPRLAQRHRWLERANGLPVFGPASPIATRDACAAVGGRFLPVVFNWMVHVNVFEDDVWGEGHRH